MFMHNSAANGQNWVSKPDTNSVQVPKLRPNPVWNRNVHNPDFSFGRAGPCRFRFAGPKLGPYVEPWVYVALYL